MDNINDRVLRLEAELRLCRYRIGYMECLDILNKILKLHSISVTIDIISSGLVKHKLDVSPLTTVVANDRRYKVILAQLKKYAPGEFVTIAQLADLCDLETRNKLLLDMERLESALITNSKEAYNSIESQIKYATKGPINTLVKSERKGFLYYYPQYRNQFSLGFIAIDEPLETTHL